jgi:hypothetical protein
MPSGVTWGVKSTVLRLLVSDLAVLLRGEKFAPKRLVDPNWNRVHNKINQLASAVWTHDNVLASADARNGSMRVSAILGTSKAIQKYTTVQDILARSMVEAIEAGFTGGSAGCICPQCCRPCPYPGTLCGCMVLGTSIRGARREVDAHEGERFDGPSSQKRARRVDWWTALCRITNSRGHG